MVWCANRRVALPLSSLKEVLLSATSTVAGFRAIITGTTAAPSNDVNGRDGFVLSGGTVVETLQPPPSLDPEEVGTGTGGIGPLTRLSLYTIIIVAAVTVTLAIPLSICMCNADQSGNRASAVHVAPTDQDQDLHESEAVVLA